MKTWSLQTKITVWIALLVSGLFLVFGAISAWNVYEEQMETLTTPRPLLVTPEDFQNESEDILHDLFHAYSLTLLVAVAFATIGVWLLTRQALKPVVKMAEAAERIHAKALHQRIEEPLSKDEVGKLALILNNMFERLEKSFIQASRFTADASHELKTPLTVMRVELESAIKNEPIDSSTSALLERLLEQTLRISSVTEKLLLLARADAGQLQMECAPVNVSELCIELIEDAEILGSVRNIQVGSEIVPELWTKGDNGLLRQALLNLIDNAVKYNLHGGKVEMILTRGADELTVRIRNTGPGIPSQHLPRLFERFYRADASRSSETGGSGLGLSLCREIILAHEGSMNFETVERGWTCFCVTLPLLTTRSESYLE